MAEKIKESQHLEVFMGPTWTIVPSYQAMPWPLGTVASMVQNQDVSQALQAYYKMDRKTLRGT